MSDEIAKVVKLLDKLVFRVAAVLEVICTLRASVDIDLELTFIPVLTDNYIAYHKPLLLFVFVNGLLCHIDHSLWHLLRGDLCHFVKPSIYAVERVDLHLVELSAFEGESFLP
jgi:hypothetical protein